MWYGYINPDKFIIRKAMRRGWWKKRGRIAGIVDSIPPLG